MLWASRQPLRASFDRRHYHNGSRQFVSLPRPPLHSRSKLLNAATNAAGLRNYAKGLEHLHAHPGISHLAGPQQTGDQAQPQLFKADASLLLKGDELLQEEVFGPTTIVIEVADDQELKLALQSLRGQLTATLIGEPGDL